MFALGRQLAVDFYDCDAGVLADPVAMKRIFVSAAKTAGATVIDAVFHDFEPQGVSGVVVISESHFAVHAWPEYDYAAVDIFTCGESIDFDVAVREIASGLKSRDRQFCHALRRGLVDRNGLNRSVCAVDDLKSTTMSWRRHFMESGASALVLPIDVYGCDSGTLRGGNVPDKLAELLTELKLTAAETLHGPAADHRFEQRLTAGNLSGSVEPEAGVVYLKLELTEFREPRQAAESALRVLGGRYYRMQPRLRP